MAAARALLGLSRAELAQLAGIHPTALKGLETGKTNPRRSTLEAVMRVFASRGIEFHADDQVEGLTRRKARRTKPPARGRG